MEQQPLVASDSLKTEYQEKLLHLEGGVALEQVTQRGVESPCWKVFETCLLRWSHRRHV